MNVGRIIAAIALTVGLNLLVVLVIYCAKPPKVAGPVCTQAEIGAVAQTLRVPRRMRDATIAIGLAEVPGRGGTTAQSHLKRFIRMVALEHFHRDETAGAWCSLMKERPRYGRRLA